MKCNSKKCNQKYRAGCAHKKCVNDEEYQLGYDVEFHKDRNVTYQRPTPDGYEDSKRSRMPIGWLENRRAR